MSVTQSSSTEGASYRRHYTFSWFVDLVNQECQTSFDQLQNHGPLCSVQDKQEGQISPVQMVNQESQTCSNELNSRDIQVSSIHTVNQECQTSLILQINQESQTFQQENQSRQETIEQENIKSQATSTKYENTENKSKESCNLDEPRISAILLQTIFRRCLECQYNLLDHLITNGCLTVEAANALKQEHRTERKFNSELIDLINPSNVEQFKEGLEASNQLHLVNFINKTGVREPPEDDEWPVSDSDIEPIIKCYPDLVRDLYYKSLIDHLFQNKCLSPEQQNSVLIKDTAEEKNRELLSIMMRRSVRQLKIFFECVEKVQPAILSESKDKKLFAVDFDAASEYLDSNAEDVADKRQKILQRSDDPALEFDARLVEDRLYFITKIKVNDGARDGCSGPVLQSNNAVDGIKQIVNEILGADAGNIVITPVHKEENNTEGDDYEGYEEDDDETEQDYVKEKKETLNRIRSKMRNVTLREVTLPSEPVARPSQNSANPAASRLLLYHPVEGEANPRGTGGSKTSLFGSTANTAKPPAFGRLWSSLAVGKVPFSLGSGSSGGLNLTHSSAGTSSGVGNTLGGKSGGFSNLAFGRTAGKAASSAGAANLNFGLGANKRVANAQGFDFLFRAILNLFGKESAISGLEAAGFIALGAGSKSPGAGGKSPGTGHKSPDAGSKSPGAGSKISASGSLFGDVPKQSGSVKSTSGESIGSLLGMRIKSSAESKSPMEKGITLATRATEDRGEVLLPQKLSAISEEFNDTINLLRDPFEGLSGKIDSNLPETISKGKLTKLRDYGDYEIIIKSPISGESIGSLMGMRIKSSAESKSPKWVRDHGPATQLTNEFTR